ncbi:TetR/AcrR family transcriptional regulator [Aquimarina aquimarini]|uniref:TetR/AcrR family transcriptional regulator n=1 Tax=Aquimarina aquimarini TaxID=1191734 RepID=UPI000D556676|nr:TetR/AcrR family transcriptional regulator [Aquimarina aquimarini]
MVRSEKTRQFIIEKTASIFNKKGYIGTYLSDLTNATGLTKGSIYGNFKDKNEVALEAFRFNYKLQTEKVLFLMKKEKSADKKLLAFLDHYKNEYVAIFKNGGCAILNTAVDSDDGNELLKQEVIGKIEDWVYRVVTILEEGIQQKELKKINSLEYAHRMIAQIEGSILLSKTLNQSDILLKNIELLKQDIELLKLK